MKRVLILSILMLFVFGCGGNVEYTTNPADSGPSIGEVHNALLAAVYAKLDGASMTKVEQEAAVVDAATEIAHRYRVMPLSKDEVLAHRLMGNGWRVVGLTPEQLMTSVLSTEEMEWWDRFVSEATPQTAQAKFDEHCARYGAPEKGSALDYATSVIVHSAGFWYSRYLDGKPAGDMEKCEDTQSWLRFFVVLGIDAGAGAAAGAGAGPIVGGIVGGLASQGANSLF